MSFYDGQMPFETTDVATSGTTVTDNAIGSRGIDAMIVTTSSGAATSFPLYDAHGNMVATLARSGSTFTTGNQRSFDACGGIRGGLQSGAPKGRYCANLGHVQDDESGLIYMRARYYEPGTGRFVSQDSGWHSFNWFSYAGNDGVNRVDRSGTLDIPYGADLWIGGCLVLLAFCALLADAELVIAGVFLAGTAVIVGGLAILGVRLLIAGGCCAYATRGEQAALAAAKGPFAMGAGQFTAMVDIMKANAGPVGAMFGENLEIDYWLNQDVTG